MSDMIQMLPVTELEPHERALHFWPETAERKEDKAAIVSSVKAIGVRHPLRVCPKENGSGYWVIDGCTRLQGAIEAGLSRVPCDVRDLAYGEIEDEVYVSNMDRTRFGSGTRIMKYLERNMNGVLKAAKENENHALNGTNGGRGKKPQSSDCGFSSNAIAERLGVSQKDVLGGIELLRCKFDGLTVKDAGGKRVLIPASESEQTAVDVAYAKVMSGTSPRRWLPAAKGHAETEGKRKSPVNLARLARKTSASLVTVFEGWHAIDWEGDPQREQTMEFLSRALESLPGFLRAELTRVVCEKWTGNERKTMEKALRESNK